jgi:propionate CoA-transferase
LRASAIICSAEEAAALIGDGMTVATSGFVGAAHPEALTAALERRFEASDHPSGLTLVYGAGQGDGQRRGLNHLAHEGLVRRVVGGHWGLAPGLGSLALEEKIEAICFPQGVICQLFRDIAAGRPGCITHIGLGTFVDPRQSGGRLNRRTPPGDVELIELGGQEWLWYKAFPIHIALIRATAADRRGNLVMKGEAVRGEVLPMAQAAHNSGGLVIAQVSSVLDEAPLPHDVVVPGALVDRIVLAEPGEHGITFGEEENGSFLEANSSGRDRVAARLPFGVPRIIASRACDELEDGSIANLGIGLPEYISEIAAERGRLDRVTLTIESGPIGGAPARGLSFGASAFPEAIIDQPAQFDFYDGRGLDFAALGAAEVDPQGNVNVAKFGSRLPGMGGFANISQTARTLVFCFALKSGSVEVAWEDDALRIDSQGASPKFVKRLETSCFSAERAQRLGQRVLYVTERAVFQLVEGGIMLLEVAPGVDIERDVVAHMQFRPIIDRPRRMPVSAFALVRTP